MAKSLCKWLSLASAVGSFPEVGKTRVSIQKTQYVITQHLDCGSSSKIYAASCIDSPQEGCPSEVAVKYVCTPNHDYLKYIDHEIAALVKLNNLQSPAIVHGFYASDVLDLKAVERCRYIIMTRVGRDLDRLINGSNEFKSPILEGLPPAVSGGYSVEAFACSVGLLTIETLLQMQSAGVVHGDLHPYNIAVSYPVPSRVVFIDFGGSVLRENVSIEVFQKKARADQDRVVDLVVWIISTRILIDYTGHSAPEILEANPLLRELKGVIGIDQLKDVLTKYLANRHGITWGSRSEQILYLT